MIAVSASARSTGMRGYGIRLCFENLETHEIYKSKSLGALSENAVLEHIPAGLYEVSMVETNPPNSGVSLALLKCCLTQTIIWVDTNPNSKENYLAGR